MNCVFYRCHHRPAWWSVKLLGQYGFMSPHSLCNWTFIYTLARERKISKFLNALWRDAKLHKQTQGFVLGEVDSVKEIF